MLGKGALEGECPSSGIPLEIEDGRACRTGESVISHRDKQFTELTTISFEAPPTAAETPASRLDASVALRGKFQEAPPGTPCLTSAMSVKLTYATDRSLSVQYGSPPGRYRNLAAVRSDVAHF